MTDRAAAIAADSLRRLRMTAVEALADLRALDLQRAAVEDAEVAERFARAAGLALDEVRDLASTLPSAATAILVRSRRDYLLTHLERRS